MNCPVCNVELRMSERQGIEIDYCPQCRGIWLDRGELDKIIERTKADYDDDYDDDDYIEDNERVYDPHSGKAKRQPPAADPTTRDCPYCLTPIPIKASKCAHCTSAV